MSKILITDDEKQIIEILERFLSKMGFEITKANSGEEALGIINSNTNIDLLILDMRMPKMSGIDVLTEMKKINKIISTIILTGSIDSEKYISKLKELEFTEVDIMHKPVDLYELLDRINKKLGK